MDLPDAPVHCYCTADFEEAQQSCQVSSAAPEMLQPKARKGKKGKKGPKQKPTEDAEIAASSSLMDPSRGMYPVPTSICNHCKAMQWVLAAPMPAI